MQNSNLCRTPEIYKASCLSRKKDLTNNEESIMKNSDGPCRELGVKKVWKLWSAVNLSVLRSGLHD